VAKGGGMSNQKLIDKLRSGTVPRASIAAYETNAKIARSQGKPWPQDVLDALRQAMPKDMYYAFIAFCPNADTNNRVDGIWREQGICSIDLWDAPRSRQQAADFMSIKVGDLVIMKKNQKYGVTMHLCGHGRVTGIRGATDPNTVDHVLIMDWSPQTVEIEVPALACTGTVNIKDVDKVDPKMPPEFHDWLGIHEQAA
jgi:hypothetical protein